MLKAKTTRKVYDNAGNEWDVHGWYLLKNGWEYWQLEPVDANGDMFGFVMGFAHEFGTFNRRWTLGLSTAKRWRLGWLVLV